MIKKLDKSIGDDQKLKLFPASIMRINEDHFSYMVFL